MLIHMAFSSSEVETARGLFGLGADHGWSEEMEKCLNPWSK